MRKQLIFLFSLPRSGSTLLQRLLAAHPKIATVSEPWLLLPLCYALRPAGVFSEYDHGTCYRALSDFIYQLPNKEEDYHETLSNFAHTLYEKAGDPEASYFLDKTPRYYLIIPEIAKIFPNAKFIFLFRNPLQIMASHIDSWTNGRLRLERYFIDLYKGPKLLSEGYENLKEKSIKVHFDGLIKNTDKTLKNIFDYLDIEYEPTLIKSFTKVKLNGHFGDKEGYFKYDHIEERTIDKWKEVFATRFRKKFARKYISKFSHQNLQTFGYSHEMLYKLIDDLKIQKKRHLNDRLDLMISYIFRICEVPLFMRKIKLYLLNKEPWNVHR
jgi:hypothetical protein